MSGSPTVSLACFGLLGTMADDGGILDRAYAEACATQGIVPGTAAYAHFMVGVHKSRGQPAIDVFRSLFPGGEGKAEAAELSFERSFRTAVERSGLSPVPGAVETIGRLRDSGVKVCLISSLSRRLHGLVLDSLDWWRQADLTLCADDVPRGFPWPDLALTAMLRLGVEDVRHTAFTDCTASGVLCGKRAGAGLVAGVLTGGHTRERLQTAGATCLVREIAGFLAVLTDQTSDGRATSSAAT